MKYLELTDPFMDLASLTCKKIKQKNHMYKAFF